MHVFASHLLAVPVIDLLDVTEDDFVFSSHVLGNPSDLQPGHEALTNNTNNVVNYKSKVLLAPPRGCSFHENLSIKY